MHAINLRAGPEASSLSFDLESSGCKAVYLFVVNAVENTWALRLFGTVCIHMVNELGLDQI